jgi:hypothetical protein
MVCVIVVSFFRTAYMRERLYRLFLESITSSLFLLLKIALNASDTCVINIQEVTPSERLCSVKAHKTPQAFLL